MIISQPTGIAYLDLTEHVPVRREQVRGMSILYSDEDEICAVVIDNVDDIHTPTQVLKSIATDKDVQDRISNFVHLAKVIFE